LTRFLALTVGNEPSEIPSIVYKLRNAATQADAETSFEALRLEMSKMGIIVSHPVAAALNLRVLRPNSSAQTDKLLYDVVSEWSTEEARLGIEIDARVMAYVFSRRETIDTALGLDAMGDIGVDRSLWRYNMVYSLLWPRGSVVRGQGRMGYNPFSRSEKPERDLVRHCVDKKGSKVDVTQSGWIQVAHQELREEGVVILRQQGPMYHELGEALLQLSVDAVDTEGMLLYPQTRSVQREGVALEVTLELQEMIQ
jgi:hypothetical protein